MWILVEETKCACFVCLVFFADFCELVGGSCRQWFNFHEEFFFLFLLPPIILYPQKTEGEHFVVLLLACSYMSLWFCFSFSHCQDKDDSDDSLTTQAFTESGFSLHPVCLSSQDDVAVFFVSHFSPGFVLLQKISIQQ
jgi:hypothetical protein